VCRPTNSDVARRPTDSGFIRRPLQKHAISKAHPRPRHVEQRRLDADGVVVPRRRQVTAAGLENRQEQPGPLQPCVRQARIAQQLRASDDEPIQVAGVICNAHGIAFVVADPQSAVSGQKVHVVHSDSNGWPASLANIQGPAPGSGPPSRSVASRSKAGPTSGSAAPPPDARPGGPQSSALSPQSSVLSPRSTVLGPQSSVFSRTACSFPRTAP